MRVLADLRLLLGGLLVAAGILLASHTSPVTFAVCVGSSAGRQTCSPLPNAVAAAAGTDVSPRHDHPGAGIALGVAGLLVTAVGVQQRRRPPPAA